MTGASHFERLRGVSVVVTGASGLLGRPLVASLAKAGAHVLAVSRRPRPEEFAAGSAVRWMERDLLREGLSLDDVASAAVIFHLAAAKNFSRGEDERALVRSNEEMTVQVVRDACASRARLVFASSQMVYGNAASRAISEAAPLLGMTFGAYACSKLNAENWVRCLRKDADATTVSLRLSGFIEGGGNIDYMIDRALRDEPIELFANGRVCREYLSIRSGMAAFATAAVADLPPGFHVYNIGSGEIMPSLEVASLIVDRLGSRSEIICTDTPAPLGDFVYDISKSRRELGFAPEPLADAIASYVVARKATFVRELV